MFTDSINVSAVIPAKPEQVYQLWMTSKQHTLFAGNRMPATGSSGFNGVCASGAGNLIGKTVELEPYRRIVQIWREQGFSTKGADSRLEVLLEEVNNGTKVTLKHTGIPRGLGKNYKQGWIDNYLEPIKIFFASKKQAVV